MELPSTESKNYQSSRESAAGCTSESDEASNFRIFINPEVHRGFYQDECRNQVLELLGVITDPTFDCSLAEAETMLRLVNESMAIVGPSVREGADIREGDNCHTQSSEKAMEPQGCSSCDLLRESLLDEHIYAYERSKGHIVNLLSYFLSGDYTMSTPDIEMVRHYLQAAHDLVERQQRKSQTEEFFGNEPF